MHKYYLRAHGMMWVLWILWPMSAYAAQVSFGNAIFKGDPQAILGVLTLSSMSGLTSLLAQMKKDYQEFGKIDHLWLYISAKMSGSNMAGLAMYFAADTGNIGSSATSLAIIFAAFGGTLMLERGLAWMSDKYLPLKDTKE